MKCIEALDLKAHNFNLIYNNRIHQKTFFGGLLYLIFLIPLIYAFIYTFSLLISKEIIIKTNILSGIKEPNSKNITIFKEKDGDIIASLFWVGNQNNIDEFHKYFRPYLRIRNKKYILKSFISPESKTQFKNIILIIPRNNLKLDLFINKNWDIYYDIYWGFDSCLMLKNKEFERYEGRVVNPEDLNDCSEDLNEFYQKNNEVLSNTYFKMWYYLNNTIIDEKGNEINNITSQNIIKFDLKYNIEEAFIHSYSLMRIERDEGIFFDKTKTKYFVNFDWVRKEPNFMVENYSGYRNRILLCNPSSSYVVDFKISYYKIIDIVSFLGGLLKFIQFISMIKIIFNAYNFDKIYTKLGYMYYFDKNKFEDLFSKNINFFDRNSLQNIQFNGKPIFNNNCFNNLNKKNHYYKSSSKKKDDFIKSNEEKVNFFESYYSDRFKCIVNKTCNNSFICLKDGKNNTEEISSFVGNIHEFGDRFSNSIINEDKINEHYEINHNFILKKLSFFEWVKIKLFSFLSCFDKRKKYKAFNNQLKIYQNLFSVEKLLIEYSNIQILKNKFLQDQQEKIK